MMKRIATGLVLAVVLSALWLVQGSVLRAALAVVTFTAVGEMVRTLTAGGLRPVRWVPMTFAALTMPVYLLLGWEAMLPLVLVFALAGMVCVVLSGKPDFLSLMATVFPIIYPGMMMPLFYAFQDIASPLISTLAMGLSFTVALLSDVFAWAVGRRFGRHPLAPEISPKKTIEGSVGGLAGSVLAAPLCVFLSRCIVYLTVSPEAAAEAVPSMGVLMVVSLMAGALSQCGDLAASTVKRYCGIKDYGNFLPGHGGIMDRIDSVLFSIVVFYIYFISFQQAVVL